MMKTNDTNKFVSLLIPNQRRIQAFIYTLVPNISDAEDIYQEAVSEMWNKFDSFQTGTDFVAWAITIAKFKVLTFRSNANRSKVQFSSKIVDILDSVSSSKLNAVHDHIDTLKKCLRMLSTKETSLLKLRYEDDMSFKKISLRVGTSAPGIHRIMAAIHSKLALCVRRTLRLEEIR